MNYLHYLLNDLNSNKVCCLWCKNSTTKILTLQFLHTNQQSCTHLKTLSNSISLGK